MAVNFAWGIDVGNRALKAIKLVRDPATGGLRVDDFEVIEHEHVLSNAGDNREALIQGALQNFVQRHPFKGGAVAIGVSGQSSFARFIKLPPVERNKIPEIVRFEAIQQIPFPLDDVEWSYQLFQDADSPDVEVGIFAMRKELVNRHIQYFSDVGLNVQTVQMSPLAVYNAMYYDKRIEGATMIIDLGAENTDLIIAEGETIWLRSIPIGGNNFTEALVKSFKLSFDKAEDLKRTAATSKYARQIFQAMRPVFADLVAEVQRSIGFYASVHRESRIKKIVTLGGTFRLPGLQKYLQQNLQLEVERIDGLTSGAPPDGKLATLFSENLLSTITAYGLAIQAMNEGKITSSLLPEQIRRERVWREKTKWFGTAAALFVIGTGVGFASYYTQKFNFAAGEGSRSAIARIKGQATALDQRWSGIENMGEADRTTIKDIKSLESYRYLWSNLLVDIHGALPKPQWSGAKAETVEQLRAEIMKTPRGQRNEILIETMNSVYRSDLAAYLAMNDTDFKKHFDTSASSGTPAAQAFGGGGGGGAPMPPPGGGMFPPGGVPGGGPPGMRNPAAAAPAPPAAAAGTAAPTEARGYLITLRIRTPYDKGPALVDENFIKALEKVIQTPTGVHRDYYIARATIVSGTRFKLNPARISALEAAYTEATKEVETPGGIGGNHGGGAGAGGRPPVEAARSNPFDSPRPGSGGAQGQPRADNGNAEKAFMDRITGEDVRDDWEFTVLVAVVIDPPPMAATPAGAAPQASATTP
jgi:type IV pilus assembly protein PilM